MSQQNQTDQRTISRDAAVRVLPFFPPDSEKFFRALSRNTRRKFVCGNGESLRQTPAAFVEEMARRTARRAPTVRNTAAHGKQIRGGLELPDDWLAWKPFGYARQVGPSNRIGGVDKGTFLCLSGAMNLANPKLAGRARSLSPVLSLLLM